MAKCPDRKITGSFEFGRHSTEQVIFSRELIGVAQMLRNQDFGAEQQGMNRTGVAACVIDIMAVNTHQLHT